ncbi:hypothetical protein EII25_04980 [Erysipelotrichaceae bacterium OH741_COT-311]|nr:hypothetical protein EII25_04980 [Erysipelotrichaceae bacterium OH741_COT-311]
MELIEFQHQKKYIKDFIGFANCLYSKDTNMQNDMEVKQLLLDQHPFSKYFQLKKYLVYQNKEVVARFVFTKYPKDEILYLGFFECIENDEVSDFLFEQIDLQAKLLGYRKIVGPVDASFWLTYRLKVNRFDKLPYTGEPYNKEYYYAMFLKHDYQVYERYTSSKYYRVNQMFQSKKYVDRYQEKIMEGYKICSPKMEDWDKVTLQLYHLIRNLYKDFPVYKEISAKDFQEYFSLYKKIIDLSMVKMVYYRNEAVGFYISVPNYHNLVYRLNFKNLIRIFNIKRKPKEYVMLYMGVDASHQGLGKAIVQSIVETLKHKQVTSIGALQKEGKITQTYMDELIEERYEYVLLQKEIKDVSL